MNKIYLLSCVSKKKEGIHRAEDLYISAWFRLAKKYIKSVMDESDTWYIMSAKHGLVRPEELLESYDMYIMSMSIPERKEWAMDILSKLDEGDREVVFIAGKNYYKYLVPFINKCIFPLAGKGIGQQLKWLKENTND